MLKSCLELEWGVAFTILLYDLSSTHNILTLRDLKKKGKRGGGGPSRRSTRARRNRLDDDFVVDGSDSEDYAPKKKKSKWASDSEESERSVK